MPTFTATATVVLRLSLSQSRKKGTVTMNVLYLEAGDDGVGGGDRGDDVPGDALCLVAAERIDLGTSKRRSG